MKKQNKKALLKDGSIWSVIELDLHFVGLRYGTAFAGSPQLLVLSDYK